MVRGLVHEITGEYWGDPCSCFMTEDEEYSLTMSVDNVESNVLVTKAYCGYGPQGWKPEYLKANGYIVVYKVIDPESFEEAEGWCRTIFKEKNSQNVPIVICGNFCDIEGPPRITQEEGENLAAKLGVKFFETSAFYFINVIEAFSELIRMMRNPIKEPVCKPIGEPKQNVKTKKKKEICAMF
ncbi:ras-related protein R-Ras2 isoform X2 [Histomonas meleagridis]|uniref:ras-related protein R-Ras2 isoform X2 n=1 Tax=Histomonas meleagridis TaxID=135588 RepID=UPI00355A46E2|nr:ras-related protein R-Ras2 isoform X2 [Histomonas meleagridis]KAH0806219.1 ras-related protein R-Ras2 isoform X2 [Histomonas meleagridis]